MSSRSRYRPAYRPTPPPAVARYAESYRCLDCQADVGRPQQRDGIWHLAIYHDDHCPVLAGHVNHTHAGLTAALETARTTRSSIAYVAPRAIP